MMWTRGGQDIRPDFLLPLWTLRDGRRFGFVLFGGYRWFFLGIYTPSA